MGAETISVVIIHPDRLHREALAAALTSAGFEVCGVFDRADTASELIGRRSVDVALVDLGKPDREGLVDARLLRTTSPQSRIVMTGCAESTADVLAAIEAGAAGFHFREGSLRELIHNARAVCVGETNCSPRVAGMLVARIADTAARRRRRRTPGARELTRRELEVLHHVTEELSNKEIAAELEIGVQTVKNHVHSILEKLQLARRDQAASYARRHGLVGEAAEPRSRVTT